MIHVDIALNIHHEEPSDGISTLFYSHNWQIDPLAAGETIIIANQTEKSTIHGRYFFEQQHKKHNKASFFEE